MLFSYQAGQTYTPYATRCFSHTRLAKRTPHAVQRPTYTRPPDTGPRRRAKSSVTSPSTRARGTSAMKFCVCLHSCEHLGHMAFLDARKQARPCVRVCMDSQAQISLKLETKIALHRGPPPAPAVDGMRSSRAQLGQRNVTGNGFWEHACPK